MACSCACKKKVATEEKKVLFEIIDYVISSDINYNNITTDVVVGSVWLSIKNKNPYLKMNFATEQNENITHILKGNYLKELEQKKLLRNDNKVYEVINMLNVNESNTFVELYCKLRERE